MDIDDILASVSGPRISQRTLDLQTLSRAWVAERTAPELLPYPTELLERVMDRLRNQVSLSTTSKKELEHKDPERETGAGARGRRWNSTSSMGRIGDVKGQNMD